MAEKSKDKGEGDIVSNSSKIRCDVERSNDIEEGVRVEEVRSGRVRGFRMEFRG